MTDLNTAREAIYAKFADEWGTKTVYTFDNEDFEPPAKSPWISLVVRHAASTQETLGSIGNRRFARFGGIIIRLFVPKDKGLSDADDLMKKVREIFEGTRINKTTIRCHDFIIREQGEEDKWFVVIGESLFEYDERK